jgi:hypothetical protein
MVTSIVTSNTHTHLLTIAIIISNRSQFLCFVTWTFRIQNEIFFPTYVPSTAWLASNVEGKKVAKSCFGGKRRAA